ncbi:TetR/AcrR family transcriptional regulator [Streptomyces sp. CB01635]|uniref:TetR/AcrR family transcriptional regulator n=1 Tax=unclassified Streptomyces TaxID=2593676 RepID=UPI001F3E23AC|nr:TetR/AcrR family transcriptional regulator [Streptomyces sp. CB01635]
MSPRRSDSRERMLRSTMTLLRVHGASATTVDRVLADSGAPRGSVYHHFPGGRTQMVEEAVALGGDLVTGMIETLAQAEDPVRAVDDFFARWRSQVEDSGFRSGCPIVAVAVETNDDAPQLARSAGQAFARWQKAFSALLRGHGLSEERSRRLAALIVAAEEGAVVLCRAQQSTAPMEDAAAEIHELLVQALSDRPETGDGTRP